MGSLEAKGSKVPVVPIVPVDGPLRLKLRHDHSPDGGLMG